MDQQHLGLLENLRLLQTNFQVGIPTKSVQQLLRLLRHRAGRDLKLEFLLFPKMEMYRNQNKYSFQLNVVSNPTQIFQLPLQTSSQAISQFETLNSSAKKIEF